MDSPLSSWFQQNLDMSKTFMDATIKIAEINMNNAMLITEATLKNTETVIKTATEIVAAMVPEKKEAIK